MEDQFFKGEPTEEKLRKLVEDQVPESIKLEYKSGDTLRNKDIKTIVKEVCAIANTSGGWLILGIGDQEEEGTMVEGQENPPKPERLYPVEGGHQEWIEQILASNLLTSVHGLNVHPVKMEGDPPCYIYVVEIPESITSPHMSAKEMRYFHRQGGQSVVMEEHLIRAAYFKNQTAQLEVNSFIHPHLSSYTAERGHHLMNLDLIVEVTNIGQVREDIYKVQVCSPKEMGAGDHETLRCYITDDEDSYCVATQNEHSLFPGETTTFRFSFPRLTYKEQKRILRLLQGQINTKVLFSGGWKGHKLPVKLAIEENLGEEFNGLPHPR